MIKRLVSCLLIFLTFSLVSCSASLSGLQRYTDAIDGYQFLYPNGWMPVEVQNATEGVDVVYRDFIERTENLSVIISKVGDSKELSDLGTPTDVGYRFMKMVNQDPESGRNAELISAEKREVDGKDYYILEYRVKLDEDQYRHNLASVVTNNGKLFTFNISTKESRWDNVSDLFRVVANSFSLASY
ncbi:photosystem II reaction center PsbP family protein [Cyanobacterium stanieri LEGE 03274]|uniref:Photosystem II reaction center PsbP family protein n=1 Tax=Cyanobacterium stanieri LEGE 03274 TaxID=1828756 RepID=A0ABR9V3H4_9CHRO|nr:photosystem II reaction center PsbP [Cyanobacterium stanieri]MBE9222437.1 photosystem II reaction center PsbP family protein [Cyanobacterium stanieri LEGE 03274]